MTEGNEYTGGRILEAMHEAVQYTEAIYDLVKQAKPPMAQRLIEFGAGDGTFVAKFRNDNVTVDCVEIDLNLRTALKDLGYQAFKDIREVERESYDFIYTINVLEHVENVEIEIAELWRALRPNGSLFVFVPAFEMLWTSLDDEVGHITRFTRKTLTAALYSGGFHISRIEYFDSLGFPAALGVRLMEKLNMFRYEPNSVKFYDRRIFPISRNLDGLLRRFLGKNLIAMAHKI